ncbi:glucoside xylosyltransferase 2-like [Hyalella azteca]|uniref:UDP-D-xylose:beta-D-glucoside alpha-1,3-D-xylosyltransferase n=1 Tax=Hyalella azteca TaxID=294128 RepID=A0A8B7NVL1_HYAAZ|nr:glucoside xylosyltransferase 2-like [Hyalella azteca]
MKCSFSFPQFRKVSSQPTLEVVEKKRLMCDSNKLIFEKMYPEEDALIYLDTDIVFLRPIEDLWRAFKNFNDDQLLGAVTPLWRIFSDKPFTELEKMANFAGRGFNSGLLLLNLTRIRSQAEKWQAALQSALEFAKPLLSDQKVFNVMMNLGILDLEHRYPAVINSTRGKDRGTFIAFNGHDSQTRENIINNLKKKG